MTGDDHRSSPEVKETEAQLQSIVTKYGLLVASIGLGKTIVTRVSPCQYALHGDHSEGHRPSLVVVPNGAVFSQWVDTLWDHFRDVTLIISNDDKPPDARYMRNWVSSTAMREAPKSLDNWPEHLRYIFDPNDARASKVVVVTPYDTHKERTVATEWVTSKKKEKRRKWKKRPKEAEHTYERPIFTSRWKGVFGMVICDEGHRCRHVLTKTSTSIRMLEAPINWSLTATPIMYSSLVSTSPHTDMNQSSDSGWGVLGGLMIMWSAVKKRLLADRSAMQWLKTRDKRGYKLS